ncbi:MAG: hypothetical protein AAF390_21230, partial [Pseudomonadota bacterium]
MAVRDVNRVVLAGAFALLAGCEGAMDGLKESETAQLVGLVQDQPCVLTRREGRRLAGAYLRRPVAAMGFDAVFVEGRLNRRGLQRSLVFDDTRIRRLRPDRADGLEGARRSRAVPRPGFGRAEGLPNVYDLTYRTRRVDYGGPLVVGPGPAATEIPSTGTAVFSGRAELELRTAEADGTPVTRQASGRFRFEAGYGSGRGRFRLTDLDPAAALPFTELQWTELFLCGARFVSSGQGEVRVGSGGRLRYPFQAGRTPQPL